MITNLSSGILYYWRQCFGALLDQTHLDPQPVQDKLSILRMILKCFICPALWCYSDTLACVDPQRCEPPEQMFDLELEVADSETESFILTLYQQRREIFFGTHFNILLVLFNDTPSTFDITFTFLPSFPCSTSFPLWGITSNSSVVPSCAFDTCNSHDFQETCNLDFRKKSEKENILSVVGQSLSTNSHIFCEA